jgi:exopolysaccharide biosynthesis predicted pyruvyltransferase EpsI
VVRESGGPTVESFGDPGVLISRIFPVARSNNSRVALVRHFTHKAIPLTLSPNMDELDVLISHPDDIKTLVEDLNKYERVITSAMHIFITCQSYGIPCALITFDGFEDSVHGNGIKYGDYAQGVGLAAINPVAVGLNLSKVDFDNITTDHKISDQKLDEVAMAIKTGLSYFD